ncbi:GAF domain-containing protein [Streptomyces sp. NPDC020917]|uniref:GAF domain-containing protein n=1 Tax=Streptomyces sp. NPDC020917 TaxID=3365102 RepID=UPI00379660D8
MPTDAPEMADALQRRLLQSIVEVARSIFGAAAASVLLLDPADDDLVFEAVAGEGEQHLVGSRFPSGTGIAGWAMASGQPLAIDDVTDNPLFARKAAESTGYVPRSLMAAPLLCGGDCVGVLEVLDRDSRPRSDLGDMASLGLLATEMATVLELVVHLRAGKAGRPAPSPASTEARPTPGAAGARTPRDDGAHTPGGDDALLRRVADRLPRAPEHVAATVTKLLTMADELLAAGDG